MKEEKLLQLMNKQDEVHVYKVDSALAEVMENEFVMTNVLRGYLNYLQKNKTTDWRMYKDNINELLSQHDVLIKKTNGFEISKHTPDFAMYLHKHTYFEIDYVYQGSCNYYIDNVNNFFQLNEKEMCIVNPNIVHGIKIESKEDIVFKLFLPVDIIDLNKFKDLDQERILKKFFVNSMNKNSLYSAYIVIDTKSNEELESILFHLFSEYFYRNLVWKQVYNNYLSLLLLELMRIEESNYKMVAEKMNDDFIMTRIINCIQKNYQFITLKDLAKDFHFHENYLSRKIKNVTNKSFNELLIQSRLQEAERLLTNTNLSISEISNKIGYSKPSYFYKLFKEHYNMTPMEYRSKILI